METYYPTINVPATSEYVLSVIIDRQRREWLVLSLSIPDDIATLTFDSTIDDLIEACGFMDCYDIVFEVHTWFDMVCDYQEWRALLFQADLSTVGDLCKLIAAHTTMPTIQLTTFFGDTCPPASTFLTIRSILNEAGVDTRSIGPSTPLHEFTRKHLETFLGPISRLAPGSLPDVAVDDGGFHKLEFRKELCSIPAVVLLFLAKKFPDSSILLLFLVSMFFLWLISILRVEFASKNKCISAQFGDLKTFRDLSESIAKHASVSLA